MTSKLPIENPPDGMNTGVDSGIDLNQSVPDNESSVTEDGETTTGPESHSETASWDALTGVPNSPLIQLLKELEKPDRVPETFWLITPIFVGILTLCISAFLAWSLVIRPAQAGSSPQAVSPPSVPGNKPHVENSDQKATPSGETAAEVASSPSDAVDSGGPKKKQGGGDKENLPEAGTPDNKAGDAELDHQKVIKFLEAHPEDLSKVADHFRYERVDYADLLTRFREKAEADYAAKYQRLEAAWNARKGDGDNELRLDGDLDLVMKEINELNAKKSKLLADAEKLKTEIETQSTTLKELDDTKAKLDKSTALGDFEVRFRRALEDDKTEPAMISRLVMNTCLGAFNDALRKPDGPFRVALGQQAQELNSRLDDLSLTIPIAAEEQLAILLPDSRHEGEQIYNALTEISTEFQYWEDRIPRFGIHCYLCTGEDVISWRTARRKPENIPYGSQQVAGSRLNWPEGSRMLLVLGCNKDLDFYLPVVSPDGGLDENKDLDVVLFVSDSTLNLWSDKNKTKTIENLLKWYEALSPRHGHGTLRLFCRDDFGKDAWQIPFRTMIRRCLLPESLSIEMPKNEQAP